MPTTTLSATELILLAGIAGLTLGSFVNLVIDRLPMMLERQWRRDAAALTDRPMPESPPFNLLTPASHCMHCGTGLRALELIPVISWLVLRGRCRHCGKTIGLRTPLVEAGLALLFMVAAWRFGPSGASLGAMILLGFLMTAAVIDLETRLLPDALTLPLVWIGLLLNVSETFARLDAAVLGAAIGYAGLWSINAIFRRMTGREGMGYGDFKLFAALGAWFGWAALPGILIVASTAGALFGVAALLVDRSRGGVPIAFGPWLALAALPVLFGLWPSDMILPA
jgi:leader peptidase (prepilin peptidase)/N-methyltransferase